MRPLPTANMFVGDTRHLRVGRTRQDDYDLDEMLGTDTDFYDQLPVADLKEFGQSDMLDMKQRSHAHHLKTAFTGIIRGSIRPSELQFDGPWVRIRELLSVFNDYTKSRWGVHEVLALIRQDNKQRFLIAGSEQDPEPSITASRFTRSGCELRMDTMPACSWTVRWLTLVSAEQGPLAPYKGRPCTPLEDIPPRLYHRTSRMLPSRFSTASSSQATVRAGRCTITSAVSRLRTCPTKPGFARICRSRLCLRRLPFSNTHMSSRLQVKAFFAGRRCRGVRYSTFGTPSRTRSCTPGPSRRLPPTLRNAWTTPAPRKWWPSLKAHPQARTWQSSLRNRVRGRLRTSNSLAPSARTTAASASSTAGSAPSLCGIYRTAM